MFLHAQTIQAHLANLETLGIDCEREISKVLHTSTETKEVVYGSLRSFVAKTLSDTRIALETDAVRIDALLDTEEDTEEDTKEDTKKDVEKNATWKYPLDMLTFIADPTPKDGDAFVRAIEAGQTAHVDVLIRFGINTVASKCQLQPLCPARFVFLEPHFAMHTAIKRGFIDIVRLLINCGGQQLPENILQFAMCHKHIMKLILPYASEMDIKHAIDAAIGHDNALECLQELFADPRASFGFTTCLHKSFTKDTKILQLFIQNMHLFNADICPLTEINYSFLFACRYKLFDNIYLILSRTSLIPKNSIRYGIITSLEYKCDDGARMMMQFL